MDIKSVVNGLCSRYDTANPWEIAKERHILIVNESLGTIRGFYSHSYQQQVIHLNQDIPEEERWFVSAHELGHAILHPKANTPFLRDCTLLSVNRLEREANQFAALLLFPDEDLWEYQGYTVEQISLALGLPIPLVQWRMEQLYSKTFDPLL